MPGVSSLTVRGYKSIRELNDFPLTNLNVLIGANGAGKSNFIGLFRLLAEMVERRLQLHVQLQGGADSFLHFGRKVTDRIEVVCNFSNLPPSMIPKERYEFHLVPSQDNRLVFEVEKCLMMDNTENGAPVLITDIGTGHIESGLYSENNLHLAFVRERIINWRVFHFHDTGDTAKVKQRHASNDNVRLKRDAANLAAYLRMLATYHNKEYQRILATIRLVMPFFRDFFHRPGEPEFVELEWLHRNDPDTPLKAHMLSDGSLRFICLATLLLQPIALLPDTILIDEPELGLHPYAITILAAMFKQVAEEKQLIVSTQSVGLINELTPQDVIVVEEQSGASVFRRHTEQELAGWLEDFGLGELWLRNVIGGRP